MRHLPTNSAWVASIARAAERDEQRRTNPMTTAIRDEITQLNDAELRKELTFARAFGAFDELSGNWLEELEAEAKQRRLEE